MSRRREVAHAAAVLLLWLAVLTFAFHCNDGRLGFGSLQRRQVLHRPAFHLPTATRKVLLALSTFDASSPSSSTTTTVATDRHHHRHRHHHHHHHHHGSHDRWNRQGVPPPTAGEGEEVDPRFGVQKRLVPTGPNPLHH